MTDRYNTVQAARLALWKRMRGEYEKLVSEGVFPGDLCSTDRDEELMLIAMSSVHLMLKKHALER